MIGLFKRGGENYPSRLGLSRCGADSLGGGNQPPGARFPAKLLAAISPFVESGGTAEAFLADPGEEISQTIIDWVEKFASDQVGEGNYFPDLTVGVAKFTDLEVIEAEPFDAFTVHPVKVAV